MTEDGDTYWSFKLRIFAVESSRTSCDESSSAEEELRHWNVSYPYLSNTKFIQVRFGNDDYWYDTYAAPDNGNVRRNVVFFASYDCQTTLTKSKVVTGKRLKEIGGGGGWYPSLCTRVVFFMILSTLSFTYETCLDPVPTSSYQLCRFLNILWRVLRTGRKINESRIDCQKARVLNHGSDRNILDVCALQLRDHHKVRVTLG